jgi:hypothetical protein
MYQSTHYRTLFELNIRHGYLLDDGWTSFDSLSDANKDAALKRYRFEDIFELVPTQQTAALMTNLRLLLKKTNQGFLLVVPTREESLVPVTGIDQNTVFTFLLKMRDPQVPYFTNLTFENGRILLFANRNPNELALTVPKIPMENSSQHIDNTFLLSVADSQKLLEARTSVGERFGTIGMVYLNARGSTETRDLINAAGEVILDPEADPPIFPPQFKVHFDTRQTFWKYIRESADFSATTLNPLPLTRYGYIELDPTADFLESPLEEPESNYAFPNPMLEIFEFEADAVYSVIFI